MAVHLSALEGDDGGEEAAALRRRWRAEVEEPAKQAGVPAPRLAIVPTPYRRFLAPLLGFLVTVEREHPGRTVAVMIPELVKRRWWQHLLHNQRAGRLRRALLKRGDNRVVVIGVPFAPGGREGTAGEDRG